MKRFAYLFYQTFLKIKYRGKRYLLYVITFYLGLLLPTFYIANIRSVSKVIYYTTFDKMQKSVQIDWFSDKFDIIEPDKNAQYSIKAQYTEEFPEWDHKYISIDGIDENSYYPLPEVKGRTFTKREWEDGSYVCLLNEKSAKAYNCQIGDMLTIQGKRFKVIGFIQDKLFENIVIPYYAMAKIYQGENVQFTGTFLTKEDVDKEKISSDVIRRIEQKDVEAEILYVTDGQTLYENALATKLRWKLLRQMVAAVTILFFILNESIVLTGKQKKEINMLGVNMALGASKRDLNIGLLIETLVITLLAAAMVGVTLMPVARCFGLDSRVILDSIALTEIFGLALSVGMVLTWIEMRIMKKASIASLLKARGM